MVREQQLIAGLCRKARKKFLVGWRRQSTASLRLTASIACSQAADQHAAKGNKRIVQQHRSRLLDRLPDVALIAHLVITQHAKCRQHRRALAQKFKSTRKHLGAVNKITADQQCLRACCADRRDQGCVVAMVQIGGVKQHKLLPQPRIEMIL